MSRTARWLAAAAGTALVLTCALVSPASAAPPVGTCNFYLFGDPPSENIGCGLWRGSRTMYLQRLLNGSWQTMLSRTTASDGTTTVGFVQDSVYQYRWVVLGSAASPAGSDGYPDGLLGSASAGTTPR